MITMDKNFVLACVADKYKDRRPTRLEINEVLLKLVQQMCLTYSRRMANMGMCFPDIESELNDSFLPQCRVWQAEMLQWVIEKYNEKKPASMQLQ